VVLVNLDLVDKLGVDLTPPLLAVSGEEAKALLGIDSSLHHPMILLDDVIQIRQVRQPQRRLNLCSRGSSSTTLRYDKLPSTLSSAVADHAEPPGSAKELLVGSSSAGPSLCDAAKRIAIPPVEEIRRNVWTRSC